MQNEKIEGSELGELNVQLDLAQSAIAKVRSRLATHSCAKVAASCLQAHRVSIAKALLATRRAREKIMDSQLFGDPAWDILLDVYVQESEGRRLSITDACHAACVPATTGLRWTKALTEAGLLSRVSDWRDSRRSFLLLTDEARTRLEMCLDVLLKARA
jgi:DNA-binding MarR family transcriptional regulator